MSRAAGILMPITSLPTRCGIGTIGKDAYEFANFLKGAGQKYWQILPVGPTSYGDSPYQSFSTFAGNPYMIDLDTLCQEGLLKPEDYKNIDWGSNSDYIDYAKIYNNRFNVLRIAHKNFKKKDKAREAEQKEFKAWCSKSKNKTWLDNYSLYMSVKSYFDNKSWPEWEDEGIRLRKPDAIKKYKTLLKNDIAFWKFVQFKFYQQWEKFRKYVNGLGIQIIGDMPIYVAMDSADTWANPEVFWLTEDRQPVCVAGCPPDYFSKTGQLWGNPIYDWKYLKSTGYKWWFERIKAASELFDITRIDHFRAFDSYWAIPFPAENAIGGSWKEGPGIEFFELMKKELGDLPIIAEDLGTLTPGVIKLLKDSGYPGMKVLEFAFDSDEENDYLPHSYTPNCVVYSGTHDNDTLLGWASTAKKECVEFAREYCKMTKDESFNWGIIRVAYESVADTAIIQMQDFLGLGADARLNTPSTLGGNWEWRIRKDYAAGGLAKKIRALTIKTNRLEENDNMDKNTEKSPILVKLELAAQTDFGKTVEELSVEELHQELGKAVMGEVAQRWAKAKNVHASRRRAYYFSAEFLMGRMMYNNLYCLNILDEVKEILAKKGIDINVFEDIDDAALGNGGLGRLAACFLDSAATHDVPLDGYGIRYKYGLFKQSIVDGFQVETADDWQRFGDPWCIRRNEDAVLIKFADQVVKAVPYDMAVIGYGTENINTLRLWEAEAVQNFDFLRFNNFDYLGAVSDKIKAEDITNVLYPNDNRHEGKVLRLKQQYFFCSASLQDIIKRYKQTHGDNYNDFADLTAIQLNDTHPVISVPELIRLLMKDGLTFEEAFVIARKTFSYTNHTVMAEALEKWNVDLMRSVIPDVYAIVEKIAARLESDLGSKCDISKMRIIADGVVHMARMAVYASSYTNGVAAIHTEILKADTLKEWYQIYPERFQNKTNGITQRRWLGLCNPELCDLLTDAIGDDSYLRKLDELKRLEDKITPETIARFNNIKFEKKRQLADYISKHEGVDLNPDAIFDIQVKRLHEYKRQLMNAFSIVDIYFKLKKGELPNWHPTAFIFGAKAAPGYARAKAIIKYINEIAKKINNDPDVNDKMKVVFVQNYNVSYAEKIVTAADFSEQISTAGTEASGTSNMKFMLNGAVTLGTLDGANVEIQEEAGAENEYIFGAKVEEIEKLKTEGSYSARRIYDTNPEIRKVIDTLIDGTFSDGGKHGEGSFAELHNSLINGASWHAPDHYFILLDLPSYVETKIKANADFENREEWGRKCLMNVANAGKFSSDRTILQYASELWHVYEEE
ncbi:MAG: 4-alpha-glucanotransferase [Clostridia bacterium]|nr:4-alpha-glucanotransferase [Clostridia bacterium]